MKERRREGFIIIANRGGAGGSGLSREKKRTSCMDDPWEKGKGEF